jgi:hypothetical protein
MKITVAMPKTMGNILEPRERSPMQTVWLLTVETLQTKAKAQCVELWLLFDQLDI